MKPIEAKPVRTVGIGAAERLTGISQRRIRYFEKLGVFKSSRDEGGWRRFTSEDIKKLKQIEMDNRENHIPMRDQVVMKEFLQEDNKITSGK